MPLEQGRTLLAQAAVLRRAKQKAAARDAALEARRVFDALGAPAWSARAEAELARIVPAAARHALTPTEARVADLVASGRSNKEVAAQLYLSVRTVEANLSRIFAKLDVRSRTELAARRFRQDG
jgi:DNA-binding NarL/FixJ family response regulator